MEEENVFTALTALSYERIVSGPSPELIAVCKCLLSDEVSKEEIIPQRKQYILSTVSRTEHYLKERRIPELLNFFLTKIIADRPNNPAAYGVKLFNECMLFRAGHGVAPVVYEDRHLKAVIKSFDPGNRGWLTAAQARRAFAALGLNIDYGEDEKISTDLILSDLRHTQEQELYNLLNAGMFVEETASRSHSSISTINS